MPLRIHLTYPTVFVLQALSNGYHYGFDIMDATELPSGTVYPILRRLEEARMATSKWEDEQAARREQRPARRYYEITAAGEGALAEGLKKYRVLERALSSGPLKTRPSQARG